jgi:hypothetical protein
MSLLCVPPILTTAVRKLKDYAVDTWCPYDTHSAVDLQLRDRLYYVLAQDGYYWVQLMRLCAANPFQTMAGIGFTAIRAAAALIEDASQHAPCALMQHMRAHDLLAALLTAQRALQRAANTAVSIRGQLHSKLHLVSPSNLRRLNGYIAKMTKYCGPRGTTAHFTEVHVGELYALLLNMQPTLAGRLAQRTLELEQHHVEYSRMTVAEIERFRCMESRSRMRLKNSRREKEHATQRTLAEAALHRALQDYGVM